MKRGVLLAVFLIAATSLFGVSLGQIPDVLPSHPVDACSSPFHVQGGGWDFCWQQDDLRAQGLELNQVYFKGESVIWKIGAPFSLTKYENDTAGPFKDTFGAPRDGGHTGFGIGSMEISLLDCPRFYGSGSLLNDRKVCVESRSGPEPAVAIWARYNIVNYRFVMGYFLDSRGHVEPFFRLGGNLIEGPFAGGDGQDHFHHLYWRVDFDIAGPGNDSVQAFLRPADGDGFERVRLRDALPPACRQQARDGITGWCDVAAEAPLADLLPLYSKWRVQDTQDTNLWGRAKSFEIVASSDGAADRNFTHFDALALEYRGDSVEVGYEVPTFPTLGDAYLKPYYDPRGNITDPVVWVALHVYHDTRDEDLPTMSYHEAAFTILPRNFLDQNPGEDTFQSTKLVPGIPGIEPHTSIPIPPR